MNTEEEHPALKFPEILEIIFKYCKVKDLKSCRLVSKLWLDTSHRAWKSSASVRVAWDGKISEYLGFMKSQSENDIHYEDDKYTLSFITFNHHPIFVDFWSQCGVSLKVLFLDGCKFPTMRAFKKVIYSYSPNMKELKLRAVLIEDIQTYSERPTDFKLRDKFEPNWNLTRLEADADSTTGIAWMDLFGNFPGLETFHFTGKGTEYLIKDIFQAINNLRREDATKLRLKKVHIEYLRWNIFSFREANTITYDMLKVLTDPALHLEELSITVNGGYAEPRLAQILGVHRTSLSKLELTRGGEEFFDTDTCFPSLHVNTSHFIFEHLQEITLHSRVFTSLKFLRLTPNLRKLVLPDKQHTSGMITSTKLMDTESIKLEKCLELEVDDLLPAEDLQKLIAWLPNVERLKMDLDNETFELVCKSWTNLVSLDILRARVDECGLTGLDADHVNVINDADENGSFRPATVPRANLTCMRHLRNLFIRKGHNFNVHRYHSDYKVCSVLYAFSELPSLQKWDIGNNLMGKEIVKTLVKCLSAKTKNEDFVKVKSDYNSHQIELGQ